MSAAPSDPPAADSSSATSSVSRLVQLGRLVDRGNWLTVGGWSLFAASTLFAALFAGPESVATAAVEPPAPVESLAESQDEAPTADQEPETMPLRVASLPGAGPIRQWPAPPADYEPPRPDASPDFAEAMAEPLPTPEPFEAPTAPPPPAEPSDIWTDTLADLPPAALDDLTAMRERFGSVVPFAPSHGAPLPVMPEPAPASPRPSAEQSAELATLHATIAAARTNLAGAFTPGYRRVESNGPTGDVRVNLTPGSLTETGRPLDLALTGPGWFALIGDGGSASATLTRDGSFRVQDGSLVLAADSSWRVRGTSGGPIAIEDDLTSLHIDAAGHVLGVHAGEADEVIVGRVAVVAPADAAAVEPLVGSLYRPLGPVHPVANAPAKPGFVEQANVDVAAELARIEQATQILALLGTAPALTAHRSPTTAMAEAFEVSASRPSSMPSHTPKPTPTPAEEMSAGWFGGCDRPR
ncbi:hypothetical protein [Alienimonas chondri]|uniref:FecR protein domain-containing protein n=1 Tax=Alienimonas chondri TaxID=2681879 RepID=A0ABX1VB21_9PLAN|nr:hypothetical protein [Alienimonas chondri]NNJ25302.1 hypothetical protein [Alienimonas chondri]